jgi:hypothetical protein
MQTGNDANERVVSELAPAVVEKWARVGVSTEPVDREAVEAAVGALYVLGGAEPPQEVIWCRSPVEAARLVANAVPDTDPFGASVREELRTGPWERARAELQTLLGWETYLHAWRETCGPIAPIVARLVEQISSAIVGTTGDEAEQKRLLVALTLAVHGQHDASWLPLFEAYREVVAASAGGAKSSQLGDGPVLHALALVAEQVHWWWPFAGTVILCERPSVLHVDERGRLHHGDGPALSYSDGFTLYRWRGVTITEDFAGALSSLTPEIIRGEQNAELRRIMLEHYGHDRYIMDSGAEPMHEDETGRLWRVSLPGDEAITMVEVVNSTAEPDGTFKTYWLRVPPHTRTSREAVAWTFGLTAQDYQPRVQT